VLAHRVDGPSDAPALVLAGSLGSTMAMWEPQLALLADLRLVRFDHPGHGSSGVAPVGGIEGLARQLLELLDHLGIARASFCGLSLGGAVAMRVAFDAPERVERLILACTAGRFRNAELYGKRAELVRREGLEPIADSVIERWFTPGFRSAEPATVRRYRAMLVLTPPEGYARCCEAVRDWDGRGDLHRIAAPTLAVAGADDPATPPADAEELAAAIPDARAVVLSPAAHLANVERPRAFADAVKRHLDE
jgi:3-oxoadipate enol-lactonase